MSDEPMTLIERLRNPAWKSDSDRNEPFLDFFKKLAHPVTEAANAIVGAINDLSRWRMWIAHERHSCAEHSAPEADSDDNRISKGGSEMDTVMQPEALANRNRSASIAALAAALAAAQKNFAPIPKDREVTVTTNTGGTYKFRYATLDGICKATVPALAEQGLAISQALTEWGDNYAIETALYHSSGEWISNVTPMFVSGRRTKDGRELPPGNQELGSAQTYARRYGLSALLCITADDDDDGNHADGHSAEGERVSYKPRAGSAGGGGQFRGERRQASASGTRMAAEEPHLIDNRPKGTLPANGKKTPADKARDFTNEALKFFNAHKDDEAACKLWWAENVKVPSGASVSPIAWLLKNFPDEHKRLQDAYEGVVGLEAA